MHVREGVARVIEDIPLSDPHEPSPDCAYESSLALYLQAIGRVIINND